MSVTIELYNLSKRTNSTKQPTAPAAVTLTAEIKAPCSILTPVLELATDPSAYNYCYVDKFQRYYFISDITFNRGLWIVSLSVDTLATYKTAIGNYSGYVLRSASERDEYIKDAFYANTGKSSNVTNVTADTLIDWDDGVYVVNVLSGGGNGTLSYQLTPANFSDFYDKLNASISSLNFADTVQAIKNSIQNPIQYVTSCYWFPSAFSGTSGSQAIQLGPSTLNVTGTKVLSAKRISYTLNVPKHPQAATIGKYVNLAPFSNYSLTWGPLGTINLDSSLLVDAAQIIVGAIVDAATGQAIISASAVDGNSQQVALLFECTRAWGVPVQVNASQGNVMGAISSVAMTAAAAAAGNIPGVITAGGMAVTNGVDAVQGKPSSVGSSGSLSAHNSPLQVEGIFFEHVGVDVANNGRPLCKTRTISTLSGYTVLHSGAIDLNCIAAERAQIRAYLEGGFYYE